MWVYAVAPGMKPNGPAIWRAER